VLPENPRYPVLDKGLEGRLPSARGTGTDSDSGGQELRGNGMVRGNEPMVPARFGRRPRSKRAMRHMGRQAENPEMHPAVRP